jgi:hypothetical protein
VQGKEQLVAPRTAARPSGPLIVLKEIDDSHYG